MGATIADLEYNVIPYGLGKRSGGVFLNSRLDRLGDFLNGDLTSPAKNFAITNSKNKSGMVIMASVKRIKMLSTQPP